MRCLTLARVLRTRGAECRFICRGHDGNLLHRVRDSGFEAVELPLPSAAPPPPASNEDQPAHAAWLGAPWQRDAEETAATLRGWTPDWLVIDHYAIDRRWESALRPHCGRIMAIDDLADRDHDCDLLLDQNLVADFEHRYDSRVSEGCAKLLGPEYALLQPEYAELHPRTPPRLGPVERILISFGGADQHNLTGKALDAFFSLGRSDIEVDVVINPASPHAPAIRRRVKTHGNITLHESLPTLAYLMLKADLAIGAGGATSWERCCMGLPSIIVPIADNQHATAEALRSSGVATVIDTGMERSLSAITASIDSVCNNTAIEEWSQRCLMICDGRGALRVADMLSSTHFSRLAARPLTPSDWQWFHREHAWPARTASGASADCSYELRDFYRLLCDAADSPLLVVETLFGTRVGHVYCQRCSDGCCIDCRLLPTAGQIVHPRAVLTCAITHIKGVASGALSVRPGSRQTWLSSKGQCLRIAVCSGASNCINESIPESIACWLCLGHHCQWTHDANDLRGGDVCFFLSYGHIVSPKVRSRFRSNVVVHASDLPKGRGWSPIAWRILEGNTTCQVTLLEAADRVDSGAIIDQTCIEIGPTDLSSEWRRKLSVATRVLIDRFVFEFPENLSNAREQTGEASYYRKRTAADSELDVHQSLAQQFDLLRVVDNLEYPAFFRYRGRKFILRIEQAAD